MKHLLRFIVGAIVCAAPFQAALGQFEGTDWRAVVTIKSDGSSEIAAENVQPKATALQQLRAWERYMKMQEEGADFEPGDLASAESRPVTDEELRARLLEIIKAQAEEEGKPEPNATVTVASNEVRVAVTQSFPTLRDLLQDIGSALSAPGVMFESVRFETTNNALKVTLSPSAGGRYLRQMKAQLKLAEVKGSLRFVFPGKVLSSDFPETEGNATGFTLDAKSDNSLDAAVKLQEKAVVITAEAGGLKMDEPLDSRTLQRSRHADKSGDDLPLVDAEPGFIAEPLGLAIRSVHLFPEGEKRMGESLRYMGQRSGVAVNAKVFAPKGRIVLSALDAKVVSAKDDKGREIRKSSADGEDEGYSQFYSSGSEPGNSAQIQLELPLPESDAQAIDELNGEVITVTAGGWKQIAITNVQSASTNEVDLSEILPGAKMVVKKTTSRSGQVQAQVQVTGPEAISRLDLKLVFPGNEEVHSYSSNRGSSTRSGTSTRTVDVQAYTYGMDDEAPPGPATLIIRYPQDLKRERVRFVLEGLDLL